MRAPKVRTHCEKTHAVFAAPRNPPTSLLAVRNSAPLPRLCYGLTSKARVRFSWATRALLHDEARDLNRFGSYVTGPLPRTHPLLENEKLDDRLSKALIRRVPVQRPEHTHVLDVLVQAAQSGTSQRSSTFRPYFAFHVS